MTGATATAELISYRVANAVAVVTFERPERRNAWTAAMQHQYRVAMVRANQDPDVRVVVVTGAGDAFCVGGDMETLDTLADRGSFTPLPGTEHEDPFGSELGSFAFVQRVYKPVIAAINGTAAGTGFILAAFCDLRFAAEGAKLTTAMARLGLPAEQGLSWILPRLVGPAAAFELLVASEVVTAERALEIGLVNRVIPADELLPATIAFAERLAAGISPASARMMKRQLFLDLDRSLAASISEATTLTTAALASADFREGVNAFLERRTPAFAAPS
jgi:enoyl-CoA hydratase/carnithine racemase